MSAFLWLDDDKIEAHVAAINLAQRDAHWWHGRIASWAVDFVGEPPPDRLPSFVIGGVPKPPAMLGPGGVFRVERDSFDAGMSAWLASAEASFRVWNLGADGKVAEVLPDIDRRYNLSAADVRAARDEVKAIDALRAAAVARLEKLAGQWVE